MLGLPGRDEQIENYQTTLRNVGRAGIPILGFHFMPNSVWRTERLAPGRGGAGCTKFDMAVVDRRQTQRRASPIPAKTDDRPMSMPIFGREGGDRDRGADVGRTTPTSSRPCCRSPKRPASSWRCIPDDPPVPMLGGVARIFKEPAGFKRAWRAQPEQRRPGASISASAAARRCRAERRTCAR